MEIILSIAGSDSSAGAGIQQDIKTITAMGCYGATVITAITSQNTMGVQDVMAVPDHVVRMQLNSVLDDLDVSAVKIGQIPDRGVAVQIVEALKNLPTSKNIPIVYDPVMVSTSGHQLMATDCVDYIMEHLFEICTLVTPNLPETRRLLDMDISTETDIDLAGHTLSQRYQTAFLIKGGHSQGDDMIDRLYFPDGDKHSFKDKRICSSNLHGTGCTLSSAIASQLASGNDLVQSIEIAKHLVTKAIINGQQLSIGHGNGPLWVN